MIKKEADTRGERREEGTDFGSMCGKSQKANPSIKKQLQRVEIGSLKGVISPFLPPSCFSSRSMYDLNYFLSFSAHQKQKMTSLGSHGQSCSHCVSRHQSV